MEGVGACAFERGMSILPSASPMYSVCRNSLAAETPAPAGQSRYVHSRLAGVNTARLDEQGMCGRT